MEDDGVFERLNATTGKTRGREGMNGAATYSDIKFYGSGYLLLIDMAGYRDRGPDWATVPDKLNYADGTEADSGGWSVSFPIGAKLAISGSRIWAVKLGDSRVTIEEIIPGTPRTH